MDGNIENIINEYNSIDKINESFVHDMIRRLFDEFGIKSSSEDIVYANKTNDIDNFFGIEHNYTGSDKKSDIILGRTDIKSIGYKTSEDDITHGDMIVEVKNIKCWTSAIKLLIYKQKSDDILVSLIFSSKKSPISYRRKYVIYQTLNKHDIIVLFFDDLVKDIINFKDNFIRCIEFNLKNVKKEFSNIVNQRLEHMKNEVYEKKSNLIKNIIFKIKKYEETISFISSFNELSKCNDIKANISKVKCIDAYAALSAFYGKITLVKHAITLGADNYDELIKISLSKNLKDNILDFILKKHSNIKQRYIECYYNSIDIERLKLIERYSNNLNYDIILKNLLTYYNLYMYSDVAEELILYLISKINTKVIKYNEIFGLKSITDSIIANKITVDFTFTYNGESKNMYDLLNILRSHNLAINGKYFNINTIAKLNEIEKNVYYFDEIIKSTKNIEIIDYCINKPILNLEDVLMYILQHFYISDISNNIIKKLLTCKKEFIDNIMNIRLYSHISRYYNDNELIEKLITNGYNDFKKFCNNYYIINKYLSSISFNDILYIAAESMYNDIVMLCINQGANNWKEIARNKNRNLEIVILCIEHGADNFNEIVNNSIICDVIDLFLWQCSDINIIIEKTIYLYQKAYSDVTIDTVFDLIDKNADRIDNHIIEKLQTLINESCIFKIFSYTNIITKVINNKNIKFLCNLITILDTKSKNIFDTPEYEKIDYIYELCKYFISELLAQFIIDDYNINTENILYYFLRCNPLNVSYILYVLTKYAKYLNFNLLIDKLIEKGILLPIHNIILYADNNIDIDRIYNKLTFKEIKSIKKTKISATYIKEKYSYIEFYRFIIDICNIKPNDIATKAVKANNIHVLKMAIEKGANNMESLLDICKKDSKIHSLLKKY